MRSLENLLDLDIDQLNSIITQNNQGTTIIKSQHGQIKHIPICNINKIYGTSKSYPRVTVTFHYDLQHYCENILYIFTARRHKRSLFSWLPMELIKTILIYSSFLI